MASREKFFRQMEQKLSNKGEDKGMSKETAEMKEKPVFGQVLDRILYNLGLSSTLGPCNENGGVFYVHPDSVRNWRLGRSTPNTKNYNDLRMILSRAIDYQRIEKSFSLNMYNLVREMKMIFPSDSQQIDYYAERYYSAVESSKAAKGIKEGSAKEITKAAPKAIKALSEEEAKKVAQESEKEIPEEVTESAKDAILSYLAMAYCDHKTKMHGKQSQKATLSNLRVTIWSPVNVWVYVNDESHPLMYIDRNDGFDYQSNTVQAQKEFTLIFQSKGFTKKVTFSAEGSGSIKYDLGAILRKSEIIRSYDREEAVYCLKSNEPTAYTFKTLGAVGTKEDLRLIVKWLKQWDPTVIEDGSLNFLIACACEAMADLEIKHGGESHRELLEEVFEKYQAKESYGYMIVKAQKKLSARL